MVTLKMSAPLWLRWATIAVEHEGRAEVTRRVLEARKAAARSLDMHDELEAALIGISAAAHAIHGLYGIFREHLDHELRETWNRKHEEGNGPPRSAQVFETLKRVAGVKPPMGPRIEGIYDLRDTAVHHADE